MAQGTAEKNTAASEEAFTISRTFDAPRELVWKAWTDPDQMIQWWGPKGFRVASQKLDFRPGGKYLYCLQSPGGQEMWGKFIYREIVEPEKLVFVTGFSDKDGNITKHPMSPTWPSETLSTITFEAVGEKTRLTIHWLPLNATEVERATFQAGKASMSMGWTGTLDQLAQFLAGR